jgi:biopolymer transport protein ExbD|tara:strand:- start:10 stop:453 length:444 start_codon:yes stop_codon:yes gene_type:complete
MRRPSVFHRDQGALEIKMTPMIDVVFLLLVFFVWTASFHAVEYLLPSSLSQQLGNAEVIDSPPPEAEFEDVIVRILWQDDQVVWQVNGQDVLSLDGVKQRLQLVAGIKTDAPVILHPDEEVPVGDVIDVYDISRIAGFDKIQFAIAQ